MTCTDFLAKLTDFFDGNVPPALMAEVEQHIAECKHCEVVLDSTTKTIRTSKVRTNTASIALRVGLEPDADRA